MTDQPTPHGVNLLKGLLFERETRRLDEIGRKLETQAQQAMLRDKALDERIDVVFGRAGTEEALQHSVAGIIDGALREAEVARHDQLSLAIAPLIVQTIKTQLRDSQDEMVDALYPITGRLVKSYVQSAIADMMAEINAKLGGGRPAQRADQLAASGLTPGEMALADANKLRVEELFLLRRSGDLIAHWSRPASDGAPDASARPAGDDRDALVSGYLGGIMALSEDAFGAEPGNFRTISLGNGERIFVRGSAAHLLAVRCAGSASAPIEAVIDEVFIETLDRYQKTLSADAKAAAADRQAGRPSSALVDPKIERMLPQISEEIEHDTAARQDKLMRQQIAAQQPSFRRLYVLFALLATPFVVWGAWSGWRAYQTAVTEGGAQRVLAEVADIQGVPPRIDVRPGGREVTLSGFVPTNELRERILSRLHEEIPQSRVRNQLGVLPKGSGPAEIAIAELRQQWQQSEAANRAAYALARPFTETTQRLAAVEGDLARLENSTDSAAAKPTLHAAAVAVGQAQTVLANARPMIVDADRVDPAVSAPLAAALDKLRGVEVQLSSLFGTAPPPADGASRDDPAALAQAAWLAAERLGVLARARLVAPQRSPFEAFAATVQTSAVFFENGTDIRDAAQADATIARLAARLTTDPDLVLRIVGYTDEKGGAALNTNLGQARASRVAALFADKGVPARQLVAIGRQQAKDLSRATGPGNVNRRVEFEVGLPGEKGDQ